MEQKNYLIDFDRIAWESPAPGIRIKRQALGNRTIRLVEFSEQFAEKDWCTKGHTGYVLKGALTIDFSRTSITFGFGDGLHIPEGEDNKHRAHVARGERALVVLFEET